MAVAAAKLGPTPIAPAPQSAVAAAALTAQPTAEPAPNASVNSTGAGGVTGAAALGPTPIASTPQSSAVASAALSSQPTEEPTALGPAGVDPGAAPAESAGGAHFAGALQDKPPAEVDDGTFPPVPDSIRIQRVQLDTCGARGYAGYRTGKHHIGRVWKKVKPILKRVAMFLPGGQLFGPATSCVACLCNILDPCIQMTCYGGVGPPDAVIVEPIARWDSEEGMESKHGRTIAEGNRFVVREARTESQRLWNKKAEELDLYHGPTLISSARQLTKCCCCDCGSEYGSVDASGRKIADAFVEKPDFCTGPQYIAPPPHAGDSGSCCRDEPVTDGRSGTMIRKKDVPPKEEVSMMASHEDKMNALRKYQRGLLLNIMDPGLCTGKRGNAGCCQEYPTLYPARHRDQGLVDLTEEGFLAKCNDPCTARYGEKFDEREIERFGMDRLDFLSYLAGRVDPGSTKKVAPSSMTVPDAAVNEWADRARRINEDQWHVHFPPDAPNRDRVAVILFACQEMQKDL